VITAGSVPTMSIPEINVDELAAAIAAGARVVDVRETAEYVGGHIPGAVHVALGTVADHVDAFRGEGPTYVVCKVGGRSMKACELLVDHGIDVVNVAGGTMAWTMSGRAVVDGDQPA
jgi:rhodanese-related sulfurtransferase